MTDWKCTKAYLPSCGDEIYSCLGTEKERNHCPEWALVKAVNSSSGNLYTMRKIGEAIQ